MAARYNSRKVAGDDASSKVEKFVEAVRLTAERHFDTDGLGRIVEVRDNVIKLYNGRFEGYQRCDTHYHNLKHIFDVVCPYVHIVDGWNNAKQKPLISFHFFELGTIAALLHDTGYIKEAGDDEGTGGKYTFKHIGRSVIFAEHFLSSMNFKSQEINSICNMILCTGVVDKKIIFSCDEERICGYALGTADLIGQLSDDNYPERIPVLYDEFREGYNYEGVERLKTKGTIIYGSAGDLLKSTPSFYDNIVKKRFKILGSLDRFIKYHWPDMNDYYKKAIEKNISRIKAGKP
jgi:hypothetical protein